jgi:hypothetical protein
MTRTPLLSRMLYLGVCVVLGCRPSSTPSSKMAEELAEWQKQERMTYRAMATRVQESLRNVERIELVYLVPHENYGPPKQEPDVEYFNWWKVTARKMLTEKERLQLVAGLADDVEAHWEDAGAMCFEPRHALRLYSGYSHQEVVLCFKCTQLWCFEADGTRVKGETGISRDLKPWLDSLRPADDSAL